MKPEQLLLDPRDMNVIDDNDRAMPRDRSLRRRSVLAMLLPVVSASQAWSNTSTPKRVGLLHAGGRHEETEQWETDFLDGMKARNWVLGRDLVLVHEYAGWQPERSEAALSELIRQKVDVIILYGDDEALAAAARATRTVPIVFREAFAPVEQGLVESYARPGRNLTGTAVFTGPEFIVKRLEFLRSIAPSATRLFWLFGSGSPVLKSLSGGGTFDVGNLIERSAASLGMTTRVYRIREPSEVGAALAAATAWSAHAVSGGGSPVFLEMQQVVDFALKGGLPTAFSVREYVYAGGLLSYGVPPDEYVAMADRFATQIDKVLRGAPPATIPVELPRRFELCINAKTARAIGLAIPWPILARADEVVR